MEAEAIMIVVDNSHYVPKDCDMFKTQFEAIRLYCRTKFKSNPKTRVGVATLGCGADLGQFRNAGTDKSLTTMNVLIKEKKGVGCSTTAAELTRISRKGRNVVLQNKLGPPKIVNDGETVLKEIQLEDPLENVGVKLVRQAGAKTNDRYSCATGMNPIRISRGMQKTVDAPVTTFADILKEKTNHPNSPKPPTPITIHSCPDINNILANSIVVELVSIDIFSNLHTICEEAGIPATKIKYLGGLHALLELQPKSDIGSILSNTSHLDCFKNIQPWTKNFQVLNRLAWISIEGLPPQAWHEAAFTRIARAWGEIIFPEKCKTNNLNLVAGKVCIRTKCMDIIQHNMPVFVDDILTCVRIREHIGECYELCPTTSTTSDDEVSTNYGDNFIADQEVVLGHKNATDEDGKSEDEDESYDDDSDEDLFTNEYLDGDKEQFCGGFCDHLNQEKNTTMASSEFSEKASPSFPVTFENDATLSPKDISSNIDKVDSDAVVEDCLIKDKSKSTNKVANQKVNYEGLVAVSAFSNGSQSSSRDTCGSKVKNHIEKSDEYYPVVGPPNLNSTHLSGSDALCTTQKNGPKGVIVANHLNSDFGLNGERPIRPYTLDTIVDCNHNNVNSSLDPSFTDNETLADFIANQTGKLASHRRRPNPTRPFRSIKLKDVVHSKAKFNKKKDHNKGLRLLDHSLVSQTPNPN
ncbi:RNA-directed DNA polymerase, eukaryota [Tanacetum coccineum]